MILPPTATVLHRLVPYGIHDTALTPQHSLPTTEGASMQPATSPNQPQNKHQPIAHDAIDFSDHGV